MTIEELPQPIKDYIMEATKNEYEYKENRFSISELVYCLRKAYYRRKFPIEADLNKAWWFFRGRLFHEAFGKCFTKTEVPVTHRIKGSPVVISGRLDVMHDDQIIEFKTTNSLKFTNGVKPQHRKQAEFYAWCQGLSKASVVYLDLNSVKRYDIEVNEEDIVVLEGQAKILYDSIKTNIPPRPDNREDWECRMCEFADRCEAKVAKK